MGPCIRFGGASTPWVTFDIGKIAALAWRSSGDAPTPLEIFTRLGVMLMIALAFGVAAELRPGSHPIERLEVGASQRGRSAKGEAFKPPSIRHYALR